MSQSAGNNREPLDTTYPRRGDFANLFADALEEAIKMECDEHTQNAISDAYRHLIGECRPEECEYCPAPAVRS